MKTAIFSPWSTSKYPGLCVICFKNIEISEGRAAGLAWAHQACDSGGAGCICASSKLSAQYLINDCFTERLRYCWGDLISVNTNVGGKRKQHRSIAMDRQTFIDHFKLLLVHLHDWTSQNCFNELSDNYKFLIEPSERTISDHLTEKENSYVKEWNKLQDKQLSFDQVVNLFYQDNQTPKWVDSSIYFSTPNLTVVHLFFSRQFRDENEIYYLDRGTGPFKAVVGIPPDNRKVVKGDKFDVNWQKYWDDEKKQGRFIAKLKRLFTSG